MMNRRGIAMLAALWLVVGITVVLTELALVGREHREAGLAAVDRARGGAAALGAFSLTRARLDYALQMGPRSTAGAIGSARAADPWLGADSVYGGAVQVDDLGVDVSIVDLGARLNVNTMSEAELTTLFSYLLRDVVQAGRLAQAIADWMDPDDIRRTNGAERDDYIKANALRLPPNGPLRNIEDLLDVKGMTPDIYAVVSPYLTTIGSAQVNLNSAPPPVLRVLPGMTDEIVANILNARSRGMRINSVADVMPRNVRGGNTAVGRAQQTFAAGQQQQISARAGVLTTQLEVTMLAYASPSAVPVRLRVVLQRENQNGQPGAAVISEEWR